ncbi:MAG: histidine phosphatase family protein [Candidatus Rokubacteria bacterium]|nr:histidine phosphatase family protein [Candidatus Rokubacteria bacterium]
MTRATTVYLIRHGSVVGAETRRFIGHLDVPLSPLGEAQCRALAARLRGVGLRAVYTSDLTRARRSGEIIAAPAGLSPRPLPSLREMSMGRWDGLTAAEIEAREPAAFATWVGRVGKFPFPGGESVPDLIARAWPAFEAVARAHAGESIAVVAHGGTNRAIICRAVGVPFDRLLAFGQDYASLSVLEWRDGGWSLRRLNEGSARVGDPGAARET